MKKYLWKIILLFFCVLWIAHPIKAQNAYTNIEAKVIKTQGTEKIKKENEAFQEVQNVTIRILEGEYENEEYDVQYVLSESEKTANAKDPLVEDNRVLIDIQEEEGEISSITIQEIIKQNNLYLLLALCVALFLIVGRKKAVKPLGICMTTAFVIYFVFMAHLQKGWNLLLLSAITAVAFHVFVSIFINGIGRRATITIFASLISVGLSGIIAFFYYQYTKLSGQLFHISILNISVHIKDVFNASVILSSSGICFYLASVITQSLEKLKKEDKNITWKCLTKLGIEEGVSTFTNISYLPMLLCFCSATTLIAIAFTNNMNEEIISLILAYLIHVFIASMIVILIASFLYSFLNRNKIFYKMKSENIIEGQRSLKL